MRRVIIVFGLLALIGCGSTTPPTPDHSATAASGTASANAASTVAQATINRGVEVLQLTAVALTVAAPTATPSPSPTPLAPATPTNAPTAIVSAVTVPATTTSNLPLVVRGLDNDPVNVRQRPSMQAAVIDLLEPCVNAVVTGSPTTDEQGQRWLPVRLNNKDGYVRADLVDEPHIVGSALEGTRCNGASATAVPPVRASTSVATSAAVAGYPTTITSARIRFVLPATFYPGDVSDLSGCGLFVGKRNEGLSICRIPNTGGGDTITGWTTWATSRIRNDSRYGEATYQDPVSKLTPFHNRSINGFTGGIVYTDKTGQSKVVLALTARIGNDFLLVTYEVPSGTERPDQAEEFAGILISLDPLV